MKIAVVVGTFPFLSESFILNHITGLIEAGSFWTAKRMSAIMASEGAWVGSDHSTYFNIVLGLGVIGLGVFLCVLCLAFVRSISLFKQYHDVAFAFSISFLLMMTINMALETIWFQPYMCSFLGMIILAKLAVVERGPERFA